MLLWESGGINEQSADIGTMYIAREKTISTENLYAQDPVFNDMDRTLLESIGFKVVQDPEAFSLVKGQTFLYAPGAERNHLVKMLAHNPVMFFGSSLDSTHSAKLEEDLFQQFLEHKRTLPLPEFESNPTAFWRTTLYWDSKEETEHPPGS